MEEDYVILEEKTVETNSDDISYEVVEFDEIDRRLYSAEVNHARLEPVLVKRLHDAELEHKQIQDQKNQSMKVDKTPQDCLKKPNGNIDIEMTNFN
jgi:hypothetical protein